MRSWTTGTLPALLFSVATGCLWAGMAISQPVPHAETDEGKHVFQKANCIGCHKWHGDGGGGYGGAALSLRKTELTREQIVETIKCGRPGTGMPYHWRDAYEEGQCYGLKKDDLNKEEMPPAAATFLRPKEIEAVVDYITANIIGKGEPTLGDCQAFWGAESRICDNYRKADGPATAADGKSGG
jgi:mono/diheme cytochrome c family protein